MINVYEGDLIVDSKVLVVAHQVNCQGAMGRGIAKQIHETYPRVYDAYIRYINGHKAIHSSPLGSCQLVWTDDTHTRLVANLFGQYNYGTGRQQTDYEALREALHSLAANNWLRSQPNVSIGFPYMIGCALGGGNWDVVEKIIREEFADYPGEVEIWRYKNPAMIDKARKIVKDIKNAGQGGLYRPAYPKKGSTSRSDRKENQHEKLDN